MKKLSVFLLAITLIFSLSACSIVRNMTDGVNNKTVSDVSITEEEALEIALNNANISKEDISNLRVELDLDDGIYHYDIDFNVGMTEYEYNIHATDGTILEHDMDID